MPKLRLSRDHARRTGARGTGARKVREHMLIKFNKENAPCKQ